MALAYPALVVVTRNTMLDFDTLMYKMGCVVLGVGATLLAILPGIYPGYFTVCFGYKFVDLLMFTLAIFLASSKRMPLNLVSTLLTAMLYVGFMLGVGAAEACMRGTGPISMTELLTITGAVVLVGATLLLDSRNARGGWGSIRPSDEAAANQLLRNQAIERICAQAGLTTRQREVLELLLAGTARKEIAERLILSEDTVKVHIRTLYQKLGIHSAEELSELVTHEVVRLTDGEWRE